MADGQGEAARGTSGQVSNSNIQHAAQAPALRVTETDGVFIL
jgi:hypothetical protein